MRRPSADLDRQQRGVDDVIRIDLRVSVQIRDRPRLTEGVDPEGYHRRAEHATDEAQGVGRTVQDGHDGGTPVGGREERLEVAGSVGGVLADRGGSPFMDLGGQSLGG